jgi:hypothetical protein
MAAVATLKGKSICAVSRDIAPMNFGADFSLTDNLRVG